jgi:UDP-N-acetylglucosamine:LPS N-acetylglucosamine transferase
MMSGKHILILTSKTGGGHVSLAEALRDMIVEAAKGVAPTITLVDPQPGFFDLHYRVTSRYALWLWAAEFHLLDTPGRALAAHRIFTRLVRSRLHALLDDVRPDLILTTYPFLSYEVMSVLRQRASGIPCVMIFADPNGVHAAWLTERQAAATFATTRETYEQALAAGFAPERLHLVGWPVRAQFLRAYPSSREMRREGFAQFKLDPDRFTVFLQGGGEGAARAERAIESLLAVGEHTGHVQVILATGTNRALFERYKNVHGVATLPFTKEIAPVMAAADVIMGKAGPNMLFEAVMLGKPFIATAYIPGQEQANLPFIQRHGLGWVALQPEEQRALLTSLIANPDQLSAVSSTIDAYRRWNSSANAGIVPLLTALAER